MEKLSLKIDTDKFGLKKNIFDTNISLHHNENISILTSYIVKLKIFPNC
jgi:hypothetical protein